ncbi:hypothetical protein TEA_009958 [Camellia sinensis var. sinensis]|uniref:Cucumisin n=1 Tax=Camellia sinensis var. sinensis TaxID=542762 RepID=A0A4S4EH56_CAMSN|nr:hypothetical protein TEA_009958 [Camellia sinensis var. sinensis]
MKRILKWSNEKMLHLDGFGQFCLVAVITRKVGPTTYIVYMGDISKDDISTSSLHTSMLEEVVGSSRASKSLLHSYKRSFNGFVAKLTEEEKEKLASMEGIVSVFPNEKKQLLTTRSWDFMGFPQEVKRVGVESDIIVGMIDTGIWPESDSFKGDGFGPPPSKWKGTCQASSNFTCNNKIIGAKYYKIDGDFGGGDIQSPRDTFGHGTHTASTAAGGLVSNASLFGFASGIARGAVPSARIAVYKVCWHDDCSDVDILAAFDDAIADGVDVISISLGGSYPLDYFNDSIAIGAFHSMKNGILTSSAAGNSGPGSASIKNFSPWSLSVAASTIDRKFITNVILGNNMVYKGVSINTFNLNNSMYPLVYAGDVPNTQAGFNGSESRNCSTNSLDKTLVNGTIILCNQLIGSLYGAAIDAGAIGILVHDDDFQDDSAFEFSLPASFLNSKDGSGVSHYINSTSKPMANIAKSIESKDELAPFVVSFSSRGPNPITRDILKPDLTAPGVEILAAYSEARTMSGREGDTRVVQYNIESGTSMACPHATGAAAYVKSFHPEWSPAAIKSALMTTEEEEGWRRREGEEKGGGGGGRRRTGGDIITRGGGGGGGAGGDGGGIATIGGGEATAVVLRRSPLLLSLSPSLLLFLFSSLLPLLSSPFSSVSVFEFKFEPKSSHFFRATSHFRL